MKMRALTENSLSLSKHNNVLRNILNWAGHPWYACYIVSSKLHSVQLLKLQKVQQKLIAQTDKTVSFIYIMLIFFYYMLVKT